MKPDRKSALVTLIGGLLVAAAGVGIAAATGGAYIAVGGILVGALMAVAGAWRFSRIGSIATVLLIGSAVAYMVMTRSANQKNFSDSQSFVKAATDAQLIDAVNTPGNGARRKQAAYELRMREGREGVPALIKVLESDRAPSGSRGPLREWWSDLMLEHLGTEGGFVRETAIESLGELEDPRAIAPLLAVLRDPQSAQNHDEAVRALVSITEQQLFTPDEWAAWWSETYASWRLVRAFRDGTENGERVFHPLAGWTRTAITTFSSGDGVALIVGCFDDHRALAIDWGTRTLVEATSIQHRIGDKEGRPEKWERTRSVTWTPAASVVDELLAAKATSFRAEAKRFDGRAFVFTASTDGLAEAIAKVECRTR